MFYVYGYWDVIREEYFYIGKGKGRRVTHHLNRKDKHPFTHRLQKMIRLNLEYQIHFLVDNILDDFEALFHEIDIIHRIGRKDKGLGPLLNLTDGGDGAAGAVKSLETVAKSVAARKETMKNPQVYSNWKMSIVKSWDDPISKANRIFILNKITADSKVKTKMSANRKDFYLVTPPDKDSFIIKGLGAWCKEAGHSFFTARALTMTNPKNIKSGSLGGYKISKIEKDLNVQE